MIERLLILIVLAAVAYIAYRLFTRRQLERASTIASGDSLLNGIRQDVATIVYFTTPNCAPCRLQQTPTLNRLQDEMGDSLQIIRVDATQDPEAAQRWGVMTVPTTFIIDKSGKPRHVHNGVVDANTLKSQLMAS